jgi:hypothetical protein
MSNRNIIDYRILSDRGKYLIASQVKDLIEQGWQPYGDYKAYFNRDDERIYEQAMVKYE